MASIFDGGPGTTTPAPAPASDRPPVDAAARALGGRLAAGYLALQAVLGIVLWALAASLDDVRSGLEVIEASAAVTDGFRFADLAVAVVASALGAWGLWRERPWALAAVGAALGSVLYPTAFLVSWVPAEGTGEVALVLMVLVSVASAGAMVLAVRAAPGVSRRRSET